MTRIIFDSQQRPVIRDTGILLHELLDWIGDGTTEAEIIHDHPCLEHADFEEAFRYGLLLMHATRLAERMNEIRFEVHANLSALRSAEPKRAN
jgi:uncharacterized protein (DUF433 family)